MAAIHPDKIWWTASEIAEAVLPDMPTSTRRISAMADRLSWRANPTHARKRKSAGGGWE